MNNELDNITNVPPSANPKISVLILGFALLWFDKDEDCADFGFINVPDNKHPLTLEICKDGERVAYHTLKESSKIMIQAGEGERGMGKRYHAPGLEHNDPNKPENDFRWMLDMDLLHSPLQFKENASFFARMRLKVNDATFFTATKSRTDGTLFEQNNPTSTRSPKRIGQVIGIASEKENIELRLNDGDNLFTDPEASYTVIIRYHCERTGQSNESDFKHVYGVLETPAHIEKLDLIYAGNEIKPIAPCEAQRFVEIGNNVTEFFTGDNFTRNTSPEDWVTLREKIEYMNHRVSCEVACQDLIAGEISRSIPW